jgi:hypothetical protein
MPNESIKNISFSILEKTSLDYLEKKLFFKRTPEEVRKITSIAFLELLKSDLCDDKETRNLALDALFINLQGISAVGLKIPPDDISELPVNFNY